MPLRFVIDDFGDHLHTCTQHAGATSGAHEHILTALQRLFTKAGYRTDRKHVPHSRGLKKADLLIKDFQLQGVRDVIVDVTCRYEFRGSCANQERNGEPSRAQFLLPHGSHDDLRENQRRLPPPALHTVSPPSSKLLHTHGHHRSIPPGIQTTPRLVLLLQSRRHRPRVRPGHCNEDRHRPHKRPRKKTLTTFPPSTT